MLFFYYIDNTFTVNKKIEMFSFFKVRIQSRWKPLCALENLELLCPRLSGGIPVFPGGGVCPSMAAVPAPLSGFIVLNG
jgi:hypothetical protein